MPIVDVDEATAALVANGRVLPAPDAGPGPWAVVTGGDALLAVYEPSAPARRSRRSCSPERSSKVAARPRG